MRTKESLIDRRIREDGVTQPLVSRISTPYGVDSLVMWLMAEHIKPFYGTNPLLCVEFPTVSEKMLKSFEKNGITAQNLPSYLLTQPFPGHLIDLADLSVEMIAPNEYRTQRPPHLWVPDVKTSLAFRVNAAAVSKVIQEKSRDSKSEYVKKPFSRDYLMYMFDRSVCGPQLPLDVIRQLRLSYSQSEIRTGQVIGMVTEMTDPKSMRTFVNESDQELYFRSKSDQFRADLAG